MGTHTYVRMQLSDSAYKEIADKLREAGYNHVFMENGVIDMNGIGVSSYDASHENVVAHLNKKLNEAVDRLAADHGVTREELLTHARNFIDQCNSNQLRTELKNKGGEDK